MMFYVLNDFSDDEIESIAEKIQSEKERYISQQAVCGSEQNK